MNFRVGQKVVCVNDTGGLFPPPSGVIWNKLQPGVNWPIKGQIYTVAAVGLTHPHFPANPGNCIAIAELNRGSVPEIAAFRFRPVVERKTDISIFTRMLTPTPVPAKVN